MFQRRHFLATMLFGVMVLSTLTSCVAPTEVPIDATRAPEPTPEPSTLTKGVVAEANIQAAAGGAIELDDRTRITIPPGALYDDTKIIVAAVDEKPPAQEGILLPGNVFEIKQEGSEVFKAPVCITIPYQEELLPSNRIKDEIFAVFWYNGDWHRVYGEVDVRANTITVDSLHNGLWTWGVDKVDNAVAVVKEFFGIEKPEITSTSDARKLVEETRQEFISAWKTADFTVKTLEESVNPMTIIEEVSEVIVVEVVDAAAVGLAGKAAVVEIAGTPVLAWGGGILSAIYVGRNMGWSVLTVEKVTRLQLAEKRYEEAKAILWVMEHPNAKTMPPHYAEALRRYTVNVTQPQVSSETTPTKTAPPATATPVPTPTPVPTKRLAALTLQQAVPMARDKVLALFDQGYLLGSIEAFGECNLNGKTFYSVNEEGLACQWRFILSKPNPSAKPTEPGGKSKIINVTPSGVRVEDANVYLGHREYPEGYGKALPDDNVMDSNEAAARARELCPKFGSGDFSIFSLHSPLEGTGWHWFWSATVYKVGSVSFDAATGELIRGCD